MRWGVGCEVCIEAMGMVGKRAVGLWGRNEYRCARLPTLRRIFFASFCVFCVIFLFFGQVGKRLLWYEVDAYGQQKPVAHPTIYLLKRLSLRLSTTLGSAKVEVSPKLSTSLAARIILPERVLGNPGAH